MNAFRISQRNTVLQHHILESHLTVSNNSHDNLLPALPFLPFLSTIIHQAPIPDQLIAFQPGHHTTQDFETYLLTHPSSMTTFQRWMTAQSSSLPPWHSVIPFASEFSLNTTPETPLFVDVGDGNGHQSKMFRETYPELEGWVVLQDLESVVEYAGVCEEEGV